MARLDETDLWPRDVICECEVPERDSRTYYVTTRDALVQPFEDVKDVYRTSTKVILVRERDEPLVLRRKDVVRISCDNCLPLTG
jgi:hypothetical protein